MKFRRIPIRGSPSGFGRRLVSSEEEREREPNTGLRTVPPLVAMTTDRDSQFSTISLCKILSKLHSFIINATIHITNKKIEARLKIKKKMINFI